MELVVNGLQMIHDDVYSEYPAGQCNENGYNNNRHNNHKQNRTYKKSFHILLSFSEYSSVFKFSTRQQIVKGTPAKMILCALTAKIKSTLFPHDDTGMNV